MSLDENVFQIDELLVFWKKSTIFPDLILTFAN